MKANELRIGNWVDIEAIDIQIECLPIDYDYSVLHPIHLTEEWLVRFGNQIELDEIGYYQFYTNGRPTSYGLGMYAKDYCLTYGGEVTKETYIKYVHQLQNLYFALTGEELNIKMDCQHEESYKGKCIICGEKFQMGETK